MDESGKLTIYIYCIGLNGSAVVTSRKAIATRYCDRNEAQLITNEHSRQAANQQRNRDYEYIWQVEPVALIPATE